MDLGDRFPRNMFERAVGADVDVLGEVQFVNVRGEYGATGFFGRDWQRVHYGNGRGTSGTRPKPSFTPPTTLKRCEG